MSTWHRAQGNHTANPEGAGPSGWDYPPDERRDGHENENWRNWKDFQELGATTLPATTIPPCCLWRLWRETNFRELLGRSAVCRNVRRTPFLSRWEMKGTVCLCLGNWDDILGGLVPRHIALLCACMSFPQRTHIDNRRSIEKAGNLINVTGQNMVSRVGSSADSVVRRQTGKGGRVWDLILWNIMNKTYYPWFH